MQTGQLGADGLMPRGSMALLGAPPASILAGIFGHASAGAPSVGFPEMLSALTSNGMATLNPPHEMAEQNAVQPQHPSSHSPSIVLAHQLGSALGSAEDPIDPGALVAGKPIGLPGTVALDETSRADGEQPSSRIAPSQVSNAAGTAKPESGASVHPRKDPRREIPMKERIEAPTLIPGAPLLIQPGTLPVPMAPLPIPAVEARPATRPQLSSPAQGSPGGRPGMARSASAGSVNVAGREILVSATQSSTVQPGEQAGVNTQSPHSGTTASLASSPHKVPALASSADQPDAHLLNGRVPISSLLLSRDDATQQKVSAPLESRTSAAKPSAPTRGGEIVTEAAAKATMSETAPQHLSPPGSIHNSGHTGLENDRSVNSALPSGNNGVSLGDRNPFHGLDSLSPDRSLHLRSSSNVIEAGVESASYGWIEVKATSSAGLVSASIHASDPAAAPAMQNHLQGLSSFLSEQAIPVRELTVGTGLAGGNGDGRNDHPADKEERTAGAETTRGPTPEAISTAPELASSSVISLHA